MHVRERLRARIAASALLFCCAELWATPAPKLETQYLMFQTFTAAATPQQAVGAITMLTEVPDRATLETFMGGGKHRIGSTGDNRHKLGFVLGPIGRRDYISWIDSAKKTETRCRRIEKTCSMLAAGKRRPCCYSIVSFNLYKALAANPFAKAQWGTLTPDERRVFISWMDSVKQRDAHKRRIQQSCVMLAEGKRHP